EGSKETIENPRQQTKEESKPETGKNSVTSRDKTSSSDKPSFHYEQPVAVISPLDAKDYNGKSVTVKGFIADIYQSEKVAYLNFVEKYPDNPFTAVIFSSKFADFPGIDKYLNKNVEVTGRVSMFRGKPQIILFDPEQLKMKD